MTTPTPFRISQASLIDAQADLASICGLFGLTPTGALTARLTRTPAKTLHRIWGGNTVRHRHHLELVARFAREVSGHMFADPAWSPERAAAMRCWLEEGEIEMNGSVRAPIEVLSDPDLLPRALASIEGSIR